MPEPLAICLEDLDLDPEDDRYLRCVALPGGEPGLCLDAAGGARWQPDGPIYAIWVSADQRLMISREQDGPGELTVQRAGRSCRLPPGKPVVLLDGDLLLVGARRLRVHNHGEAEVIHPPEPLRGRSLRQMLQGVAAAAALGATVGFAGPVLGEPARTGGEVQPIEVRARPPKPVARKAYTCTIVSYRTQRKKRHHLVMKCPTAARLKVGMTGELLDPKTNSAVPGGRVVVKSVSGTVVVGQTEVEKLGEAKKVRFWRMR